MSISNEVVVLSFALTLDVRTQRDTCTRERPNFGVAINENFDVGTKYRLNAIQRLPYYFGLISVPWP